jgi:hypothetical protein
LRRFQYPVVIVIHGRRVAPRKPRFIFQLSRDCPIGKVFLVGIQTGFTKPFEFKPACIELEPNLLARKQRMRVAAIIAYPTELAAWTI